MREGSQWLEDELIIINSHGEEPAYRKGVALCDTFLRLSAIIIDKDLRGGHISFFINDEMNSNHQNN